MPEFVQGRAVPVDRLEIGLRGRHLHIVVRRHIEGAIAADTEIDARRFDQSLDARLDEARRWRRSDGGDVVRQAVALRGVEDGEALEERNRGGVLTSLAGSALLVLRREAIGIDDGRAVLAFADIAAQRQRLTEGEPALAREAALDHRAPEDEHVDAGIVPSGRSVAGHGERRLGCGRPPWLDPGSTTRLKLGDDLVGDVVIEARPA